MYDQDLRREEGTSKKVSTEGGVLGRLSSKVATSSVPRNAHISVVCSQVVTSVTEFGWKYDFSYELLAFRGVGRSSEDFLHIRYASLHLGLPCSLSNSYKGLGEVTPSWCPHLRFNQDPSVGCQPPSSTWISLRCSSTSPRKNACFPQSCRITFPISESIAPRVGAGRLDGTRKSNQ